MEEKQYNIMMPSRTKKELEIELYKKMYSFVKYYKGMTNGAIVYLGLTEHREEICKEVAKTKTEYETMLLDYDKVYKKIKTTFKEDMNQELIEKQKKEIKREPLTIFGVHWALFIFLFPIAILMVLFDSLDNKK